MPATCCGTSKASCCPRTVSYTHLARVVARVESDEKRDRTMLDSAALEFLDADGHVITDSSITVLEGEPVSYTHLENAVCCLIRTRKQSFLHTLKGRLHGLFNPL